MADHTDRFETRALTPEEMLKLWSTLTRADQINLMGREDVRELFPKLLALYEQTRGLSISHKEDGCWLIFEASTGTAGVNLSEFAEGRGDMVRSVILQWIEDVKPSPKPE